MSFQLQTERLILRTFRDEDLNDFLAYRNDPKVAFYQSWTIPYSREQGIAFIDEMAKARPGEAGVWFQIAIELKTNGAMIGDCVFCPLKEDARQAEIGYSLAGAYQGKGYASEAIRRLLDYLFGDLELHRVRAICDVENVASARLLERVGMRREGHFVESFWTKGRWSSEYWYAILRREWQRQG
jgi:RimJ/RimL family protein N-acetyltransferase